MAAKAAAAIMGFYRKADFAEPEVFVPGAIRVLSAYPEEVVRRVADPLTGIAGRQTFPPSIAELKAECDRHMEPLRQEATRRERVERERRLLASCPEPPTPDERRRAVEEWERRRREIEATAGRSPVEALALATGLTPDEAAAKLAGLPDAS